MVLETGIETLDRKLGGGVPRGTIVTVLFPPELQVNPLLCAGAGERKSLFFTTVRSPKAVRKMFERAPVEAQIETIEELDPTQAADELPDRIASLGEEEDFYIDVVDPLETNLDEDVYVELLNLFTEHVETQGGLGYLYAYDGEETPNTRNYTLDMADFVIKLRTRLEKNKLAYYLEIPKASGLNVAPRNRFLEVQIGTGVDIDETRNI